MTLLVKTLNSGTIEARFFSEAREGIKVGEFEIPMEDFLGLALHCVVGGFNGWVEGTPAVVVQFLNNISVFYEYTDGTWVRKKAL
jgi:hypothetical protein